MTRLIRTLGETQPRSADVEVTLVTFVLSDLEGRSL